MYWYQYQNQDINDYRIKCIISEHGYQAYWIYMNLIDISIPENGLLRLDPKQISIVLNMQSPDKFDELTDTLKSLEDYKLITHEPGYYVIHTVRERVGNAEERLLNSKSFNQDEKRQALLDEVMTELSFAGYCSLDAAAFIKDAIDKLLKRYNESEILKATKQFALDYAVATIEEREKIDNIEKYYFSSIIKKLAKPSSTQKSVFQDTFIGLLKDAKFFESPKEIKKGYEAYEILSQKYKPYDVLEATKILITNISLNEKKIQNKCGYLISTISKILRHKPKKTN